VGRCGLHGSIPELGARGARLASRSAPASRPAALALRALEEKPRGFQVLPRRWVVERTFAWLGQARRLAEDYERLPQTAVAMIYGNMSRIMLRSLVSAVG
jgi:transposase